MVGKHCSHLKFSLNVFERTLQSLEARKTSKAKTVNLLLPKPLKGHHTQLKVPIQSHKAAGLAVAGGLPAQPASLRV